MQKSNIPPFACPVCDSQFNGTMIAQEELDDGQIVAVQICPLCGLHITYPRLDEPQGTYAEMTRDAWQKKYGGIDRGDFKHDRHQNYEEEVRVIQEFVPSGGRVLDVGCHSGWLLGYLQKTGAYELEGLEPSPTLAQIAHERLNVPIHQQFLQQFDAPERFDGLICTDVLEHINPEDLHSFLQAAHKTLKPGAHIFIKTPNVKFTALKAQITERLPEPILSQMLMHRDLWDAKEHVILWDEDTLRRMFERMGFVVDRFFVPLPVETRNSPFGALLARRAIYQTGRLLGGAQRIPNIAQDIFLVAHKPA